MERIPDFQIRRIHVHLIIFNGIGPIFIIGGFDPQFFLIFRLVSSTVISILHIGLSFVVNGLINMLRFRGIVALWIIGLFGENFALL